MERLTVSPALSSVFSLMDALPLPAVVSGVSVSGKLGDAFCRLEKVNVVVSAGCRLAASER